MILLVTTPLPRKHNQGHRVDFAMARGGGAGQREARAWRKKELNRCHFNQPEQLPPLLGLPNILRTDSYYSINAVVVDSRTLFRCGMPQSTPWLRKSTRSLQGELYRGALYVK